MACRAPVRFFAVGHQPLKHAEMATVVRAMIEINPCPPVVGIAAEFRMVLTEGVKRLCVTSLTPIFTDLSQVEITPSMFPVTGNTSEFALFGFRNRRPELSKGQPGRWFSGKTRILGPLGVFCQQERIDAMGLKRVLTERMALSVQMALKTLPALGENIL